MMNFFSTVKLAVIWSRVGVVALVLASESPQADSTSSTANNNRPRIRKLGTIDVDIVETTPIVWQGEIWWFEWVRPGTHDQVGHAANFRFRNRVTGAVTPPFASGYQFGSAFVEDGTVYVTRTTEARRHVSMFVSRDLKTWKERTVIDDPKYGIFNTSLWKAGDHYVLAFEIDRPRKKLGCRLPSGSQNRATCKNGPSLRLNAISLRSATQPHPACAGAKDGIICFIWKRTMVTRHGSCALVTWRIGRQAHKSSAACV